LKKTLLRQEIVAELRAVIERYPKSSKMANLQTAVVFRTTPELAISSAEIAAAFYPESFGKYPHLTNSYTHALMSKVREKLLDVGLMFEYARLDIPGKGKHQLYAGWRS
jgi:hypothetical protein